MSINIYFVINESFLLKINAKKIIFNTYAKIEKNKFFKKKYKRNTKNQVEPNNT